MKKLSGQIVDDDDPPRSHIPLDKPKIEEVKRKRVAMNRTPKRDTEIDAASKDIVNADSKDYSRTFAHPDLRSITKEAIGTIRGAGIEGED